MNSEGAVVKSQSRFIAGISIGKDVVSLARDLALTLLAVLLIAFPEKLNVMLTGAGFEEGSFLGLKWKSKLLASDDALKQARATISDLQSSNDELTSALKDATAKLADPPFARRLEMLETENETLRKTVEAVNNTVSRTIEENAPFIKKAQKAREAMTSLSQSAVKDKRLRDYKVDVFWCDQSGNTAKNQAYSIRGAVDAFFETGRQGGVRPISDDGKGPWASGYEIRVDPDGSENSAGIILKHFLAQRFPTYRFAGWPAGDPTPRYLSIFVCPGVPEVEAQKDRQKMFD